MTDNWNDTLRILYTPNKPWQYKCGYDSALQRRDFCAYPGSITEIVGHVLGSAGVTYELVLAETLNFGEMLSFIENDTVDTIVDLWVPLPERLDRFTASAGIQAERLYQYSAMFATNSSDEHEGGTLGRYTAFLKVYSPTVWLLALMVGFVSRLYMHLYHTAIVSNTVLQRRTTLISAFPSIGLGALLILLLFNLYRNGLLSAILMVSEDRPWFTTAHELFQLVDARQTYLVTLPGIAAKNDMEKERQRFGMEPFHDGAVIMSSDLTYINFLIAQHHVVYVGWELGIQYQLLTCGYSDWPLPFMSDRTKDGMVMLFNKRFNGSKLIDDINKVILRSPTLFSATMQRYEEYGRIVSPAFRRNCTQRRHASGLIEPLAIEDMMGIYIGFFAGLLLASGLLALEIVCSRLINRYRMKPEHFYAKTSLWQPLTGMFSRDVWLAVGICVVAITVTVNTSAGLWSHSRVTYGDTLQCWSLIGTLSQQNALAYTDTKRWTSRCLLFFIGLFMLHTISLYQNCMLMTFVQKPVYQPPVSTFGQLAEALQLGHFKLNLRDPTKQFALKIEHSDEPMFRDIRRALKRNPPVYLGESPVDVDQDDGVIYVSYQSTRSLAALASPDNCQFMVVPIESTHWEQASFVIGSHINSSLELAMNQAIIEHLSGIRVLIDRVIGTKINMYETCRKRLVNEMGHSQGSPINLWHVCSVFYLLMGACTFGIIILFIERHICQPHNHAYP